MGGDNKLAAIHKGERWRERDDVQRQGDNENETSADEARYRAERNRTNVRVQSSCGAASAG